MENLSLAEDGTRADYCDKIRTQGDENTLGVEVYRFPIGQQLEGQINGRKLSVVDAAGTGGDDPAPDMEPFKNSYQANGVDFAASRDWALLEDMFSCWTPSGGR